MYIMYDIINKLYKIVVVGLRLYISYFFCINVLVVDGVIYHCQLKTLFHNCINFVIIRVYNYILYLSLPNYIYWKQSISIYSGEFVLCIQDLVDVKDSTSVVLRNPFSGLRLRRRPWNQLARTYSVKDMSHVCVLYL